jgi:peptidoglycan/xylan/chitin deacetylase (PgdA/CDA1 family)
VTVLNALLARALGPSPNRPLLALTTVLFPKRFVAQLYPTAGEQALDWQGYRSAATLSFDIDLPEDVEALPWLLDTLAPYPFRASFACIGRWVEKEPDRHRRIVEEGHEVVNHTYSHPWSEVFDPRPFLTLTQTEQEDEIRRGHDAIARELGVEPVGFRAPHLDISPAVYRVLADLGYQYSSSALARRSGVSPHRSHDGVWEFPLSQCPRHPSSVFDTYHAFRSRSWVFRMQTADEEAFLASFSHLLRLGVASGTYTNVYFDPMDVRQFHDFPRLLAVLADAQRDVRIEPYRALVPVLTHSGSVQI